MQEILNNLGDVHPSVSPAFAGKLWTAGRWVLPSVHITSYTHFGGRRASPSVLIIALTHYHIYAFPHNRIY